MFTSVLQNSLSTFSSIVFDIRECVMFCLFMFFVYSAKKNRRSYLVHIYTLETLDNTLFGLFSDIRDQRRHHQIGQSTTFREFGKTRVQSDQLYHHSCKTPQCS